jgi:enolase
MMNKFYSLNKNIQISGKDYYKKKLKSLKVKIYQKALKSLKVKIKQKSLKLIYFFIYLIIFFFCE